MKQLLIRLLNSNSPHLHRLEHAQGHTEDTLNALTDNQLLGLAGNIIIDHHDQFETMDKAWQELWDNYLMDIDALVAQQLEQGLIPE